MKKNRVEHKKRHYKCRLLSAKPLKTGAQLGHHQKRRRKWSVPSQNLQKQGPINRKTKGIVYKSVQNQSKIKDLEKGCLRRRLQRAELWDKNVGFRTGVCGPFHSQFPPVGHWL